MSSDILNSRLPNIELSYGTLLHRKVRSDLYQLIPDGIKCLVWYTYWKGDNVCYLLHLNNTSELIKTVEKTIACFNSELCYGKGTMISGHLFKHNGVNIIAAVDIHYYKGCDLYNEKNDKKQSILVDFLSKDTRQEIYSNEQMLIALPITTRSYNNALEMAKQCTYPLHSISLINNSDTVPIGYHKYIKTFADEAYFLVEPLVCCDMYRLYAKDYSTPHGFASITDYKTSKMMNSIFRKIKENNNLDLLEESDDDEDFENTNDDKYVDLSKKEIMRCIYIKKFDKWKPISICSKGTILTTKRDLDILEKNRDKRK